MLLKKDAFTMFVSQLGATVTGFQMGSEHIIFPQQIVNVDGKNKLRGGIPIPFPWFGPHRNSSLPQHGFLRDTLFTECHQTSKNEGTMLLEYEGNFLYYPHPFRAAVRFNVHEKGFSQNISLKRSKESPIPINPGFHPYFATPLGQASVLFPKNGGTFHIDKDFAKQKSIIVELADTESNFVVITIEGGEVIGIATKNVGAVVI